MIPGRMWFFHDGTRTHFLTLIERIFVMAIEVTRLSRALGAIVHGGLRVGEMVEIDVRTPGFSLSAVAIVRYTTHVRSGFEFVGMTPEEREQIANTTGHA